MTKPLISALIGVMTLTGVHTVAAQDVSSSIVGTWKILSQVRKEVDSGATTNVFGPKPVGHIIFTKGGNVLWFFVADERKTPASPNITDAERVYLFRTLAAGSGAYKVDGKKLVVRYETSWHQLWTGNDITTDADVNAKTLTLTNAPFRSAQDGKR